MGTETVTPELVFAGVFRKAADLIDEVGLYRGEAEADSVPKRCTLTAINDITEKAYQNGDRGIYKILLDDKDPFTWFQKNWLSFDSANDVYQWNDTSDEGVVVDELRAAATELERKRGD